MKKMNRAIHFDFHTMPGIEDFGENFNAEEFARQMEKANVDYVNFFARCNIGFSYYPTKVGTPYPSMKGNLLGEVMTALKKRNIGVTVYINGGLNHLLMLQKPNIMKISKDGSVYTNPYENMNFFRTPCFNTEYSEHLLSEIEEVLQMEPDGVFIDCLIPRSCYCTSCVELMKKRGIDISDDKAVWNFAVETVKSVMRRIRKIVPREKRLCLNSFPYEDIYDMQSHAELECLPADPGEWGYDYIYATAPYYRMFTDERVYMTGAFTGGWGDFGGKKTKAALENDVYDALLLGYAPSVGDHLHPRDGINKKLYKDLSEIYGRVRELEKWTIGSKPMCDAAILRNKIHSETVRAPLTASDKGAARMLSELKICYDIVNEDMDFNAYRLLVLPDSIEITDKLCRKLEKFDGSILSSGKSCTSGSVWDYFSIIGITDTDAYYEFDGNIYGQYMPCIKMKSNYGISDYIESYFKREFDGLNAYFYNPPNKRRGYSAVVLKEGKAHICFNVFAAYLEFGTVFHKELVKSIIDLLLCEKLIEAEALPSYSRTSLMKSKNGKILHIKTTFPEHRGQRGIIEEHICLKEGLTVSVLGEHGKACALPEMTGLKIKAQNGRTEIILPEINGYKAFLLE